MVVIASGTAAWQSSGRHVWVVHVIIIKMSYQYLISIGEQYSYVAKFMSNGAVVFAGLAFAVLCFSLYKKKGMLAMLHLATVGTVTVLATYGVADIIKRLFPSPRPFVELHMVPAYPEPDLMTSFPSAHTAVVGAMVMILLLEWHHKRTEFSAITTGFLLSLIPMVGIGRMLAGHHYFHDVIAGAALGVLVAIIGYYGLEKISPRA